MLSMNSPLLALDIGFKRTGVAISESGLLCRPLTVLEARPPHMHSVVQEVVRLLRKHEARTLVVGLPYNEDGLATTQSARVEKVIRLIEQELLLQKVSVEIVFLNEFHSTQDAQQHFPEFDSDSAAAALVLQEYLSQSL